MQIKRKYIYLFVFLLVVVASMSVIFYVTDICEKKLKKNKGVTIGLVDNVSSLRGSPFQVNYSFRLFDRTIHNRESIEVKGINLIELENIFIGKKLVVVYDTLEPQNNKLLLNVRDYKNFELKPDSNVLLIFNQIDPFRIGKDAIEPH